MPDRDSTDSRTAISAACCSPVRASPPREVAPPARAPRVAPPSAAPGELLRLPGGAFLMGSDAAEGFPEDGEGPVRPVTLRPFAIAAAAVTNEQFAGFVAASGYRTDAERYGWSFVFQQFLPEDTPPTRALASAPWWRQVFGADWRHPDGPASDIEARLDHPVGPRLLAGRDGLLRVGRRAPPDRGGVGVRGPRRPRGRRYPWGDELEPDGEQRCNIWQGDFPERNTADDGYLGTAPARAFAPNGFGLYNTSGNVWEWCADWFSATFHRNGGGKGAAENPAGPPEGSARVIRGGSYLCHRSYCNRYRVAARSSNTPDSSVGNTGFRCARDDDEATGEGGQR